MSDTGQQFGGDWTTAKLDVVTKYLSSYTIALKNQPCKQYPFVKGYIDAFAGTGYRDARRDDRPEHPLVLPDLAADEPQALLDGSARLALKTQPPFDRYIFIERSPARCAQLDALKQEFPDLATRVVVQQRDANVEIKNLCDKNWKSHRAVLFLDPYGMQVDWTTIQAIAGTRAIDLWVLFPTGIGVNAAAHAGPPAKLEETAEDIRELNERSFPRPCSAPLHQTGLRRNVSRTLASISGAHQTGAASTGSSSAENPVPEHDRSIQPG